MASGFIYLDGIPGESGRPLRFPDPTESEENGFPLFSASDGGNSYQTLVSGKCWLLPSADLRRLRKAVTAVLHDYLADASPLLVCGLGRASLTPDSLGPRTVRRLTIPDPTRPSVVRYAVIPGTKAETGFETARHVRALVEELHPAALLVIDALCTVRSERLGTVLQVTDAGLEPGSGMPGVGGDGRIDRETAGCPVISVGVPLVLASDPSGENPLLLTDAACDTAVSVWASVLAAAVSSL